ncbi:hypothetical protein GCM10023232_21270 [Sphingosinicella ginsenosidimutans]
MKRIITGDDADMAAIERLARFLGEGRGGGKSDERGGGVNHTHGKSPACGPRIGALVIDRCNTARRRACVAALKQLRAARFEPRETNPATRSTLRRK